MAKRWNWKTILNFASCLIQFSIFPCLLGEKSGKKKKKKELGIPQHGITGSLQMHQSIAPFFMTKAKIKTEQHPKKTQIHISLSPIFLHFPTKHLFSLFEKIRVFPFEPSKVKHLKQFLKHRKSQTPSHKKKKRKKKGLEIEG